MHSKDALLVLSIGTAANFPWELAQSLLYRGTSGFSWSQHVACCALASLADGTGIVAMYLLGTLAWNDEYWNYHGSHIKVAATVALGLVGATVIEKVALQLNWWAYGPAMPRVVGTDLGVSPLVQFVLLPPLLLFCVVPRLTQSARVV